MQRSSKALTAATILLVACGDERLPATPDAAEQACATPPSLPPDGDPTGHPQPLGAGPTEARAGRITAAELPVVPSGLITWHDGDFVLANDKVALVIEDVGDSDLYDPWGGRPVGLARVEGGALVAPTNFGELFLLTGRASVITEAVTVVADGSDGGPAIIRARGRLHPTPFFESITEAIYNDPLDDVDAAIDYVLAPGARAVDIRLHYASARRGDSDEASTLHALMYTKRQPAFVPGVGFGEDLRQAPYMALVDDDATSWAYRPTMPFQGGLAVAGFFGGFTGGPAIPGCATSETDHAQLVIGDGDGLDGVVAAMQEVTGEAGRVISGTVTRAGQPAPGVRVHAEDADGHLTRVTTDAAGAFALHVPAAAEVTLTAYRRGDAVVTATSNPGDGAVAIDLPATGAIHVTAVDDQGAPLPARIQILAVGGAAVPTLDGAYGEPSIAGGRLHIDYAITGDTTLPVPPGTWEVVVSRGYEYELERQTVDVTAGQTVDVEAALVRSVATPGQLCGDFHVHTSRSNDAADDGRVKVAAAVCDGLELPVRSDHEYVGDFSAEIAALGLGAWAAGLGSLELTSFEVWGHMGVFPLTPDPTRVNAGAPAWQTFPTAADPTRAFATLSPPDVFDAVRARPEEPVVIINHPRGGANYFDYVGYDPITGMVDDAAAWDTDFTLVEVFNDSGWQANRAGNVADWLSILKAGRKVFAVGSSDSHGISSSPVGYPRTCIDVGSDDPALATGPSVRDPLAAGHARVSGGVYVDARVAGVGPGDTASGLGPTAAVEIDVQAASWIDVDAIEIIVDGVTVDTIAITPGDADPGNPTIRYHDTITVDVAAAGGGYVVVAAYGDATLEPVHPGRLPFGVTQPVFLQP